MTKTKLIVLILFLPLICLGEPKVFFKIAIDEKVYSSFLLENLSASQSVLHTLASRLKEPYLDLNKVQKEYYMIKMEFGMKYNGANVTQYDFVPVLPDRFRHVVLVDEKWDHILRREVYDTHNKLIYAYSYEDRVDEPAPFVEKPSFTKYQHREEFPGFKRIFKRELEDGTVHSLYSDGLNRFSVFVKKTELNLEDSSRIIYGNYVYRKKIGETLYTVVGTIPFPQMEKVVSRLTSKEDKSE